jgi:hypothetical protein
MVKLDKENVLAFAKNSPMIAPYRIHTGFSFQNLLTPGLKSKLIQEFRQLENLGNTQVFHKKYIVDVT